MTAHFISRGVPRTDGANCLVRLLATLTSLDATCRHGCERTQVDVVQLFKHVLELMCDELDGIVPRADADGGALPAVLCRLHNRPRPRAIADLGKGPVQHHDHSRCVRNPRTLPPERR